MKSHNGLWISHLHVWLKSEPERYDGARVVAHVKFHFNGCFVVRGVRVERLRSGRIVVAMPYYAGDGGRIQGVAFADDPETRAWLDTAILREYVEETNREALRLQIIREAC